MRTDVIAIDSSHGPSMIVALSLLLAAVQSPSRPAHIIIIRHAEKPAKASNPHLSKAGREHAARIVTFFTTDPAMTKLGPLAAIYATRTTKDDDGQRTQETVAPLAAKLKLPVQTPVVGKDYAQLARTILASAQYSGKTILVCWNHENIPQLVAALGVSPEPSPWKGKDFSTVYVISYPAGKAVVTTSRDP